MRSFTINPFSPAPSGSLFSWLVSATAAALIIATTGCISVHKSDDGKDKNVKIDTPLGGIHVTSEGKDKNVKIDTPLGGIHVTSDGTVAARMGVPAYPGAKVSPDKEGDKSADVRMGFGDWQFRIKVVSYETGDSEDKVLAFYKKALGRYGDVIECQNQRSVGEPAMTSEGLTCKNDGGKHGDPTKVHLDDEPHELKAGSPRHQHILGIKSSAGPGTKFALVEVDLPTSFQNNKSESD